MDCFVPLRSLLLTRLIEEERKPWFSVHLVAEVSFRRGSDFFCSIRSITSTRIRHIAKQLIFAGNRANWIINSGRVFDSFSPIRSIPNTTIPVRRKPSQTSVHLFALSANWKVTINLHAPRQSQWSHFLSHIIKVILTTSSELQDNWQGCHSNRENKYFKHQLARENDCEDHLKSAENSISLKVW